MGAAKPNVHANIVPTMLQMITFETGGMLRNSSSGVLPPSPLMKPSGMIAYDLGLAPSICALPYVDTWQAAGQDMSSFTSIVLRHRQQCFRGLPRALYCI